MEKRRGGNISSCDEFNWSEICNGKFLTLFKLVILCIDPDRQSCEHQLCLHCVVYTLSLSKKKEGTICNMFVRLIERYYVCLHYVHIYQVFQQCGLNHLNKNRLFNRILAYIHVALLWRKRHSSVFQFIRPNQVIT